MNAEEKILAGIIDEAKADAEKILAAARAEAELIEGKAKQEAKSYSAEQVSKALIKAKALKENAESGSALVIRDAKLAKKREEIIKTVAMAKKKIAEMGDREYFEKLVGLAVTTARQEEGVALLGKADLKRDTNILLSLFKKNNLTLSVSSEPADISGGLILRYGNIEYNLSLDAIIAEKKEHLEDEVLKALFS